MSRATYHVAFADGRYLGDLSRKVRSVEHALIFSRAGAVHKADALNAAFSACGLGRAIAFPVMLSANGKVRMVRSVKGVW